MSPPVKLFINQNILQVVFRQNSNASKLCPLTSYLEWIGEYLHADFPVENSLFFMKFFPYWTNVKHVKHFLYIN